MSPSMMTRDVFLTSLEGRHGSWASSYRDAQGTRQDAIELLYRCRIIPQGEFYDRRVNQDHIEECVWIATLMLQTRPLEEWVTLREEAQSTFEERVTACSTARTDLLETRGSDELPLLACHVEPATPPPVDISLSDVPPVLSSGQDDNLEAEAQYESELRMRCREIISAAAVRQESGRRSDHSTPRDGAVQVLTAARQDSGRRSEQGAPPPGAPRAWQGLPEAGPEGPRGRRGEQGAAWDVGSCASQGTPRDTPQAVAAAAPRARVSLTIREEVVPGSMPMQPHVGGSLEESVEIPPAQSRVKLRMFEDVVPDAEYEGSSAACSTSAFRPAGRSFAEASGTERDLFLDPSSAKHF